MVWMPNSPKGRFIEHVEGKPETIIKRGQQITELGDQMLDSATVLQNIKERAMDAGGQKGKAIEQLRDVIGDSYEKLREAGELYKPVGPVIERYGNALESTQPQIDYNADQCEEKWKHYLSLPGELEPRGTGGWRGPEEGSPEAEQQAEEDAAKKAAYEAWEDSAGSFDFWYDSWEDAYDSAVEDITDGLSGQIKDSRWSMFADILGWAALVMGVIALIFGGWILVAIALALAALYLFVVCMQKANGEADWGDIALAAIGIIPVTRLSSLAKFAHLRKAATMDGLFGSFRGLAGKAKFIDEGGLLKVFKTDGGLAAFRAAFMGDKDGFASFLKKHREYAGDLAHLSSVRNLAGLDAFGTTVSNTLGHFGNLDKVLDDKLPNVPGSLGFAF